jgi:hypothetical protein
MQILPTLDFPIRIPLSSVPSNHNYNNNNINDMLVIELACKFSHQNIYIIL